VKRALAVFVPMLALAGCGLSPIATSQADAQNALVITCASATQAINGAIVSFPQLDKTQRLEVSRAIALISPVCDSKTVPTNVTQIQLEAIQGAIATLSTFGVNSK